MKKILKALTVAIIAMAAVIACVFVAGCNEETETKSDYNFTIVYADGTPVNGQTDSVTGGKVWLQICTDRCIDFTLSFIAIYADENGKLSLSQEKINDLFGSEVTEFVFHVKEVKGCKDDCEFDINGKGNYTLKLTAE